MQPLYLLNLLFFLLNSIACQPSEKDLYQKSISKKTKESTLCIKDILPPENFKIYNGKDSLYTAWLLYQKLRIDNKVYLYNHQAKQNQQAQYAVLDIDIGNKNLLQCADAAIKLRADYLFKAGKRKQIIFNATTGQQLDFGKWQNGIRWKIKNDSLETYKSSLQFEKDEESYDAFMELVYNYCGTYSLSHQLKPVNDTKFIEPGNIFVQGGFPGHAITVMAVAISEKGEKVFLLAQGYMPAQDIHILKNPLNKTLSPWYELKEIFPLVTPEWIFINGSLKQW